jgi:hypothetical protein
MPPDSGVPRASTTPKKYRLVSVTRLIFLHFSYAAGRFRGAPLSAKLPVIPERIPARIAAPRRSGATEQ